ncbi:neuropeptides capa receptor-like [Macrosteles quadrilineatus]|uniref:neuropeptides capa receptor-like n=1 Tax=Macrosteles quadrilineatus TaxID=74068 RepID=UPI0023E17821|nr:neuropeptides capa receptor-like [Macrosteles quadrilineatus]XP_054264386.1 neuropeptides capa receptor-like [Macrosteles quadrilineatus]
MNEVWANDEVWGLEHPLPTGSTNISLEHYLLQNRGPKHLPLSVVVPITIVYAFIFLSGVVGNIATCVVIIFNTSLHTATNYYLFSLAVSDVTLLLLGLPNDLSAFWQQYPWTLGEPFCKLRALISEMTSYTSVLTIVAFTTERYLAICHPLLSYTMTGLRRAVRIVTVVWGLSFISALPFALFTKVNYITFPPETNNIVEESAFCGMLDENIPDNLPIYELSFIVFFLLPLCIIGVLYTKIGLQIRSGSLDKGVNGSVHGETKTSQSRKSIIRMLVAVVITFFLCWAPYHAQRLHYRYGRDSDYYYQINEWLYYVAGCFYYLSSTANPLLYNLMSGKYRDGFRRTFCGRTRQDSVRSTSGPRSAYRSSVSETAPLKPPEETKIKWNKPGRDLVVTISPDEGSTTVTTQSHWPWTELRVTMDHSQTRKSQPVPKICVEMETCL